jgi:hypothetical protein
VRESSIYDGSRFLGTVVGRGHAFKATDANGRRLGTFLTAQEAMTATVNTGRASAERCKPVAANERAGDRDGGRADARDPGLPAVREFS